MSAHLPSFQPLSGTERNHLLDALRGFASFGIILVNIRGFADYGWLTPEQQQALPTYPADRLVDTVINILVDTKFITLFSILFGTGFAILQQRAVAAGVSFPKYFSKRMFILLLIACLHAYLLWFGDIIRYYALSGFLLLLFTGSSIKSILRWAVIFCVPLTAIAFILQSMLGISTPGYPGLEEIRLAFTMGSYTDAFIMNWRIDPFHNFLQDSPVTIISVFGKILLGYWLGRSAFFTAPGNFAAMRRKWITWGLILGIPSSIAFWALKKGYFSIDEYYLLWVSFVVAGGLILHSLMYVALFIKLFEQDRWKILFTPFMYVGRTALSNYILQTIICIVLFYGWLPGFHLRGCGALTLFFVSIFVFVVQVLISRWWLGKMQAGPLEWCWKRLSYPRKPGRYLLN
ncbi:DUF418 domain-containing protein [uncultured Chitinophaga sp.]|jgi:Predicted membrane protein|uniref:DUF418 domain-containing protein n=1 Tax=uncultured Chitinophaga sp. TaxID=339340 RepID=UPI002615FF12|nr:DUF418 domain-containing protein [uncultured Chitinophaga sp.]